MPDALVAFGGNVGDARETIERAIVLFCDGANVHFRKRSSDYRTPPWGGVEQPPFINCALAVTTELAPRDLLARAHVIERAFGRDRAHEQRWGPRRLDIDLITYGDLEIDTAELTLPHPRALQRGFVLLPIAEIDPDRVIAGVRVADALTRVETAGIERLPPRQR